MDVQSPKLERSVEAELCREQGQPRLQVSPLRRGKAQCSLTAASSAAVWAHVQLSEAPRHRGSLKLKRTAITYSWLLL